MASLRIAAVLLGLLLTGTASAAPAPAPGQAPTQQLFLPQTTTVTAPVPSSSGGTAQAPVQRTTPALVTVPAPSTNRQATPPATPPTTPPTSSTSGLVLPPRVAPATAPATSAPATSTSTTPPSSAPVASTTPGLNAPGTTVAGGVVTPSRPAVAPAVPPTTPPTTSRPSSAPAPSQATPTLTPAAASAPSLAPGTTPATPGNVAVAGPAPAVAPSSSGFYNVTLQANNATGALNQAQATQLQSQIQSYLQSQGGITTTARIAGQSVGQATSSSAGRRLQQTTTFILDIQIVLGPLSPSEAAVCKKLLQGLVINLTININITVIVTNVIIFVPVPVYVPVPATINNPPNVPALPSNTSVTVPSGPSPPGTGSNIQSQNIAGGSTVTSQGITNNINSGNTVDNINSGNINNVNSGNSNVTNISNTNIQNNNNVVNNIVNNVQNPTTPGAQAPATPAQTGSSTPGTTPAPATPATPGGASSGTADTTVTPPTFITQAAPPAAAPPAVPSPPPSPPPSCGSQPQCRIYSRDMLCCQNEGILTPYQGAQIEILCTHQVRFAITCLATSGPTNISAASVYNNDYGYNYNFRTNVNWLGQTNGYLGKVTVDVEPARFASNRPECSLNLQTPCDLGGTLVSTMPTVQALSFNVIDFNSFYQNYVGYPPTNAIGQFSYSWMNNTYPGGCLEQPTLTVPGSFFLGAWPSQPGFAYPCNASATYGALQQTCPNAGGQLTSGVTGIAPN